jgi:hypothetical protein
MNLSPFKRGDYVRLRNPPIEDADSHLSTHPLNKGEIGIVTAIRHSGDRRPRYVQVNGIPVSMHFTMLEKAEPSVGTKVYLFIRHWPNVLIDHLLTWKGPFVDRH